MKVMEERARIAALVGDTCRRLQGLTREAEMAFLTYLIGIVILEADHYLPGGTQAPASSLPTYHF
jgi:hypothetical protein